MNQSMKFQIFLVSAALALVSCGGGGGGSSSASNTDWTTSKDKSTNLGTSNYEYISSQDNKIIANTDDDYQSEHFSNGDVIGYRLKTLRDQNGNLTYEEVESFKVNGEPVTAEQLAKQEFIDRYLDFWQLGGGFTAYNGRRGPSASYSAEIYTDEDIPSEVISVAPSARQTRYNDAFYAYAVSNADGTWNEFTGKNGVIEFNPDSSAWSANFDNQKVQLDGRLDGNKVSGKATYQGLSGTFEGNDAYVRQDSDQKIYHHSAGGFAGSNGTQTFAGAWGQTDNPLYLAEENPLDP